MSRKDEGLAGRRFARLAVLEEIPTKEPKAKGSPRYYRCLCYCGKTTEVRGYSLVNGAIQSCGCLKVEHGRRLASMHAGIAHSHGAMIGVRSGSPKDPNRLRAHTIWQAMLRRCYSPQSPAFAAYGGRGITVCQEWRDSFLRFVSDMGIPEPHQSIDRIDNDGNYDPGNCRWATRTEQANNTRSNRTIAHLGREQTISQWAHEKGINVHTLFNRINRGWSGDRALNQSVRSYK